MVDQATIDRVAAALEGADIGHSMSLTRLLDGVHTYTLKIRGEIETFIDNDEADAIDQAYARIREVKHRLQAEAVIAALNPAPEIAALPQDVINLVIAAREAFDTGGLPVAEERALDKALEPFSSRVPYENEPDAVAPEQEEAK
jgi:hypothetical protein